MKSETIYLSPPHISKKEIKAVNNALKSGWIAPTGSYIHDFQEKLENYFSANILLTNSGTAAIHLALKALNVQKGDIVLCSNFTFAATVFPVLYEKAIPFFIGIERETWNISPEFLEVAIEKLKKQNQKPKALIIAYCYGMPAQWSKIEQICNDNNIPIIEDAAEALGSSFDEKPLGSLGDLGILSFNGNKIITCSSGGALIAKNKQWIENSRKIAQQAKENTNYYLHKETGYNYLQSNILAAIGFEQFKKLNKKILKRRENYSYYTSRLENIILETQNETESSYSNRWLSCFTFKNSEGIYKKLKEQNIESRKLWNPLHLQPVFSTYDYIGDNYEELLFKNGLCLPSGSNLKEEDLSKICEIIQS